MVGITVIRCGQVKEERSSMALQMTWHPNLRRRSYAATPLGMKNLGNSCYLNSVLQCLTFTPPLANFCLNSQHSSLCDSEAGRKGECPFCILEKRIARLLSIDQMLDAPHKINNCLRVFSDHFGIGRQEDAHEFLRYVIDACHNTCIRVKKKGVGNGGECGGDSVVKEIIGGALRSQVKCLSCGAESNKVDEIMDISLDVLNSSSLKDALHKFFQSAVLDGNNKYKCDKCKKLVSARKQMSILQAPNVLVIQLKRFEGMFGGKIDKAIAFEEVLFFSNYMCKGIQDSCLEYNLFATVVHSGSHQILDTTIHILRSFICLNDQDAMSRWYCCNDSFVSLSTRQEVLSEKAYILFFSRSKQRTLTANKALGTSGIISNGCNCNDSSKISKTSAIKAVNPNQLVNQSLDKDNINTSKVHEVLSSSRMKSGSFGNSGSRRFPASDSVKLIFHQKESCENNGDVRSSIFLKKSENKSTLSKDMNGVAKSSDFANGGRRHSVFLTNGKDKSESISANSSLAKCEVDGIKNSTPAGGGLNLQFLQNGSGICVADKLGPKQKCKEVDSSCTTNAEDAHSPEDSGELNSKRKMPEDLYNSYVENGQPHLKLEESSSNTKLQEDNSCGYLTEELSCSGKVQGRDDCILLAKDAQSREKLEELKDILMKEAFLVLRSCGWSNDVDNFMRSKRLCARVEDKHSSNKNYIKRSLIADAKSTFLPQIPESLKGDLIERLRTIIQEKQCLGA